MMTLKARTRAAALIAALVLLATPLCAQTALTATTLGAIVSDGSSTFVTVASATGITAPGTGATFVYLLVDRELMGVRNVNGTTIGVTRGQNGTRATPHINGAYVTVAPAVAIINYVPSGQCVRTALSYVPVIVGGTNAQGHNGDLYDCLGVTTAGQYVQTNTLGGQGILGSTVASTAGVLTATGNVFKVSGTSAITGITLPAGAQPGFTLAIEPTGVFTWTTATNIILAGTAVVGKILYFTWDGAKWVPSYIA